MSLKAHFELMSRYNSWMNQKTYAAAEGLGGDTLHQDLGAFFGSIFNTLTHIMVGDIIWLKRFAAHPQGFESLKHLNHLPTPSELNGMLFDDFATLHHERILLDKAIIEWTLEVQESHLSTTLTYQNIQKRTFKRNFGHLVQHFFNHQTHHRGQITTLLAQQGAEVGVTDLAMMIPDAEDE